MSEAATRRARGGIPRAVVVYNVLLGAAVLAVSAATWEWPGPGDVRWIPLPAVAVLMALAAYKTLRVPYRDQVMALDLFESVLAGAIVVYPAPIVVALVATAHVTIESVCRNAPIKATFNVLQWMLAAACGALAFRALDPGGSMTGGRILALLVALLVVALVNLGAFSLVLRLVSGRRIAAIVRDLGPALVAGWALNSAFGVFFAIAFIQHDAALILFGVLLFVLHGAYRGFAMASADRARLGKMNEAVRTLSAPIDPQEALDRFLSSVAACFDATCVDLVLVEDGSASRRRLRADGAIEVETVPDGSVAALLTAAPGGVVVGDGQAGAIADALRAEGWRTFVGAPAQIDGVTVGALCVYDRSGPEGFEEGERIMLEALASELAGAVHKSELVGQIIEERRKLSDIVTQISDGLVTLDTDGRILTWNPAMSRITGYDASSMLGSSAIERLRATDADGAPVVLERWVEAEPPGDLQIRTRAGESRWLACSYTKVLDAENGTGMLVVVCRDTTKARELEMLKDDFVATVSHELRTPITPIKGWAELLVRSGDQLDESERAEAARSIKRQAERLERLILNMLEVSKIERGIGDRSMGTVDVAAVATKSIEEFRQGEPARALELSIADGDVRARGDEALVEQILTNLLSNAMKYAPPEQPVTVQVTHDHDHIRLSVIDHGPGIPPEDRDRIFERFRRLGDPMTRETEGTGLGLYIARQLAASIDGSIRYSGTPGGGATFTLLLSRRLHSVAQTA